MNIRKAKTWQELPAKGVVSPNPFLAVDKNAPERLVRHPRSKDSAGIRSTDDGNAKQRCGLTQTLGGND